MDCLLRMVTSTCRAVILLLMTSFAHGAWNPDKIIQLLPADLPMLSGQTVTAIRIAVVRNGQLIPVPFQIDEYNEAGLVWFSSVDVPIKGKKNIFDGDDRLLILAGDISTESFTAGMSAPPGYLGELSVNINGETRFLQIISGEFPQATAWYVQHNLVTGITETPFYKLQVDPDNELNWRHLMVQSWRGNREQSLVDTLKMRISGGVFTPITRVTLDNDNIRPKIIGQKSGPIRSTIQMEAAVVVAGIPILKMQVQVSRYPRYFEANTHARIPKLYRMALINPDVRVTIDGNNLGKSVVRTARGGNLQAVVDGVIDDVERDLIARGLNADENWLLFDSGNGFSILTFLDVPPDLRNVPLNLIYEDAPTKRNKPERIRGQQPNLGYGIRGFPPGEDFYFGVTLVFDKELTDVDANKYVALWREKPVYRFRAAAAGP